jgi:hypothetical protein
VLIFGLVALVFTLWFLWQQPRVKQWFVEQSIQKEFRSPPVPPANPIQPYPGPDPSAAQVDDPTHLFLPDTIWSAHLTFTEPEWATLQPRRIPPLADWLRPDGAPNLRNPQAARPGVAGVFGFDFPWSTAHLEFGGVPITNVGVRYKGNGTFLDAVRSYRRPFKIDLDRHTPGRTFAGQRSLNLHNLAADRSFLSDTLGYEYFRDVGIPAPRTTFVRLFLTGPHQWERRLLGLYLVVENPDAAWIPTAFPSPETALFKPVTLELFADLGPDWDAYKSIYDPKTRVSPDQRQRLLDLCQLVSHAEDAEFHRRLGEILDLDAAARFFAAEVLLANYDGIFSNGQNFLLWLHPVTGRFGFSPWDLDHSWGEFGWIGSATDREQASIHQPWVGQNHFLERLFAHPDFKARYLSELRRQLDSHFVPDRLLQRIDALAQVIRPAIAEFSVERLIQFDEAIASSMVPSPPDSHGHPKPTHALKPFIERRATSVRNQLDGLATGVIPQRNPLF